MKLTVLTYGTEGDTRPLAALSRALMGAGHEVCLLGEARTLGSAQALGVPALPLSGDIRDLFVGKTGDARASAKALAGVNNRNTMAWMQEALAAARGSDVIIASGLVGFVGLAVAEYLKAPVIGAGMIPLTPTREFPSPFLPPFHAMGWIHRVSHVFTNQMVWLSFRKAFNRARVEVLGLPEQRKLSTTHPMLYGISPTLLPQPADWPDNARMCGQWVQPVGEWTPPVELSQFLEAGPPPIYIGFGSMTGFDAARMQQAIVAALDGRRALFYPGWGEIDGSSLPENIMTIGATPHDWLFPRTSLVIHHGGSGTTHSATRAGKPSVVVPFAGDQPFWADRLHTLGIAPKAINGARINADTLAAAIQFAESAAVQARATALGAAMAREDGPAAAIAAIEALVRRN